MDLPIKMVEKCGGLGHEIFKRGPFFTILFSLFGKGGEVIILKIIFPVELIASLPFSFHFSGMLHNRNRRFGLLHGGLFFFIKGFFSLLKLLEGRILFHFLSLSI